MKGFLTGATTNKSPLPLVARCGACGLYKGCLSPKMAVSGKGQKGILILGEAPGETEDDQGRPFVGRSGQLLRDALRRYGIEMTQDCWVYNSVICRPAKNKLPEKAIDYCRPNVISTITQLKPRVIVLLGSAAVKSVIEWTWKEDPGGINRWSGFIIPDQKLNAFICPTFHPSYILRGQNPNRKDPAEVIWHKHLEAISKIEGRPEHEQSHHRVRRVLDPDTAADYLVGLSSSGSPLSYDYETDRLKPDHMDSRIVCCAFSDGVSSISFPWHGRAKQVAGELLLDPKVKKIGWSIKFEDRWTQKEFGKPVEGWVFDGMLAAHTLDARKGTKSLKFQAYARLGKESYDDAIKPYLEAKHGNLPNRISDIDMKQLLQYCGEDALLEHQLAYALASELGITF